MVSWEESSGSVILAAEMMAGWGGSDVWVAPGNSLRRALAIMPLPAAKDKRAGVETDACVEAQHATPINLAGRPGRMSPENRPASDN